MAEFRPKEIYCIGCEKFVATNRFYRNNNKYHKYNTHYYCKDCTKSISKEIMALYCNQNSKNDRKAYELAIRHICSFFDMPYIYEVYATMVDDDFSDTRKKDWDYLYQYGKRMKELGYDKEIYWNYLSGNSFLGLEVIKDKDTKPNTSGDADLFVRLEKDWGKQECLDDYLWLEEKFNQYVTGENLTTSMTVMVRYLCQAELDVIKLKNKKVDQNEVSKAEKRVTDYFSKLKLDDFKFDKAKSEEDKLIETFAFNHENIEPLDWEDENLKDRLGIDRDYEDIMRSLGNKVVGTKDYPNITEFIEKENKSRKKKK